MKKKFWTLLIKREQKKNLSKYAIVMLSEEIKRIVDLLLSCGIKITEEEIKRREKFSQAYLSKISTE